MIDRQKLMIDELEQDKDQGKVNADSDYDDSDNNSVNSNDINDNKNMKSKDDDIYDKMDDTDCNVCLC